MTARWKAAAQIMRKPIASLLYMALKSRTTQRAVNSRAVWRRRTSMASTMGVIMKITAAGIRVLGCFRQETKPPAFPGALGVRPQRYVATADELTSSVRT